LTHTTPTVGPPTIECPAVHDQSSVCEPVAGTSPADTPHPSSPLFVGMRWRWVALNPASDSVSSCRPVVNVKMCQKNAYACASAGTFTLCPGGLLPSRSNVRADPVTSPAMWPHASAVFAKPNPAPFGGSPGNGTFSSTVRGISPIVAPTKSIGCSPPERKLNVFRTKVRPEPTISTAIQCSHADVPGTVN